MKEEENTIPQVLLEVPFPEYLNSDIQLITQLEYIMCHAETHYAEDEIEAALAWFKQKWGKRFE